MRSRLPEWGRAQAEDAGSEQATGVEIEVLNPGAAGDDAREPAVPFEEVAVINCCFVEEQDVLELARLTTCRVVLREHDDDYCRASFLPLPPAPAARRC